MKRFISEKILGMVNEKLIVCSTYLIFKSKERKLALEISFTNGIPVKSTLGER